MIGTLLGNRYELIEKIGEGGMAEVYRAKCHLLNRYVAVKVLKEEYAKDNEFVEKFKREAAAVASLSDNNIVNIYDVGSYDDVHYIVMEYVKGKTLKEVLQRDIRLDYNRAIDIAIQIAKALECAHRNNIIHRDVKPHNILVTEEGNVKVTDFGIAKASSSVTITNTSKVMGSAHYFSPEQAKGSFVDFRTDIYSLGIVLYEMVTGKVPYDAESPVSVALKHIQEPVVPPKHLNPSIPEGVNQLILKAIEKEPIKRYQSIKDMIVDLQKLKSNASYVVTNNYVDDHTRIMDPVIVDEEEYEEEDDKNYVDSKKKKILLFTLLAILVIGIGAVTGWFLSHKSPTNPLSSSTAVMPDIIGKTSDDAQKAVESAGLVFTVAEHKNDDKPKGTVIECNYTAGEKLAAQTEVRVTVSDGPQPLEVRDYTGSPLEQAKQLISNDGFQIGQIYYQNNDTAPDNVFQQSPAAGSNGDKNTKIDLYVSKGPNLVTVPDLKNTTTDQASTVLQNKGLVLGSQTQSTTQPTTVTTDSSKVGKKVILSQDQPANTQVAPNTQINVTYSLYVAPAPVVTPIKIPSFLNQKYVDLIASDAYKNLVAQGINVVFVDTEGNSIPDLSTNPNYVVASQSNQGKDLNKGDTLTITLTIPKP